MKNKEGTRLAPHGQADAGRTVYFDILRVIAFAMVVVNHTAGKVFKPISPSPTWFASLALFMASKPAVPIFLMISGALLLPKQDSYKKTARRCGRIAAVLLIFSLFYYLYNNLTAGTEVGVLRFCKSVIKKISPTPCGISIFIWQ